MDGKLNALGLSNHRSDLKKLVAGMLLDTKNMRMRLFVILIRFRMVTISISHDYFAGQIITDPHIHISIKRRYHGPQILIEDISTGTTRYQLYVYPPFRIMSSKG